MFDPNMFPSICGERFHFSFDVFQKNSYTAHSVCRAEAVICWFYVENVGTNPIVQMMNIECNNTITVTSCVEDKTIYLNPSF